MTKWHVRLALLFAYAAFFSAAALFGAADDPDADDGPGAVLAMLLALQRHFSTTPSPACV